MGIKFKIVGQRNTSERELYDFANSLYEKSKALTKILEGVDKKKSKEIEQGLNVLKGVLKKRV